MKGYFLGAAVASLYISFFKNQVKPLVCTPLPLSVGGEGVELPTNFSKRGRGLDRISIFRGGCWERGRCGDFLQGRLQFLHKK